MIPARETFAGATLAKAFAKTLALASLLLLSAAGSAEAGPLDVDAGLRASIWNDNYKLGVGAQLGAVKGLGPKLDGGLHLNYSRFRGKAIGWEDVNEFDGYVTLYLIPSISDQAFELRLGPHLGAALVDTDWFADLGGDLQVVFKVAEKMHFYAAFVPSYFIGAETQGMFRVGLGLQYRIAD